MYNKRQNYCYIYSPCRWVAVVGDGYEYCEAHFAAGHAPRLVHRTTGGWLLSDTCRKPSRERLRLRWSTVHDVGSGTGRRGLDAGASGKPAHQELKIS